jgi:lipid II:glycine glycyltransferase (peptidoglycan interpeptide bridge formation enzyme)
MYQIELAKDAKEWTSFLEQQVKTASFLQSWQWGASQATEKSVRVLIKNQAQEIVFICLLFWENILKIKSQYLYAPFGPVWKENLAPTAKHEILEFFFANLDKIFPQKPAFIIFDSNLENTSENLAIFKNCAPTPLRLQVGASFIIPIDDNEEEILAKMHSKTRYNLRLAEKKGVEIFWDDNGQYFDEWFKIMESTAKRNKIRLLSKKHYRQLLDKKTLQLILAKFDSRIVAGNLVSLIPPSAVYVHGGLEYQYHQLMSPFLLQWQSILAAKKAGCTKFDFWGVNYNNSNPNWEGITRFKLGFNTQEKVIAYIPSQVKIFHKKTYYYTLFLHYLRKIKKFVLTR